MNEPTPPDNLGSKEPLGFATVQKTPAKQSVSGRTAYDPTQQESKDANAGEYAGDTKIVETVGRNRLLKAALVGGVAVAGGAIAYQTIPAVHEAVDSAFLDHLKGKSLSSDSKSEVFDNTAVEGVINEKNTIQMTREEYEKIAPPAIDRTIAKPLSIALKNCPAPDGRPTRPLTLEQGAVNAMIYIKTADGNIREVSYIKEATPGGVGGPVGFVFPNCRDFLGQKDEIQAGDRFPAPISGRVYYSGRKVEYYKGEKLENAIMGEYTIEGEYFDKKTGEAFKAIARINMLDTITQPSIAGMPNLMDPAFKEYGFPSVLNKMPVVNVQQEKDDVFSFVTKPPVQKFSTDLNSIKSQVWVTTSYQGDFGENGIANTFGGADCNHPTLDNKGIVLK